DRSERPDDWHEPGEHDRLGAMLLVEPLRLQQVLPFEEARIWPREKSRAGLPPDPVTHAVSGDRCQRETRQEPSQREMARRREQAGGDEQRVAGQEEPDQQTSFREDDRKQDE